MIHLWWNVIQSQSVHWPSGSGFVEWGSCATVLGCNINHIGWHNCVVFFSSIALGSLLVLTVLVFPVLLFRDFVCVTVLQKLWGGLMWFVTACEHWSTYRSQWLGRRDGGGRMCGLVHSVCLPWDDVYGLFWLRLEELTCVILEWCFSGCCAHQLVSLTKDVICQIHFCLLLDLLFSPNFCTCTRPLGLVSGCLEVRKFPHESMGKTGSNFIFATVDWSVN